MATTAVAKQQQNKTSRTQRVPKALREQVERLLLENFAFMDSPVFRRKHIERDLFELEAEPQLPPTAWYQPTSQDLDGGTANSPKLMKGPEERMMFLRFNYSKRRLSDLKKKIEKDGLTKEPDVASRLDLARLQVLQQASAQKYLKDHTPADAELRAEYESQLASAPLVEYQARHILVSSEDVAQKVIQQLKSGNDFATLAKRLSGDTQSAQKGGELGWFGPRDMDPKITNAIALLKKGEVTPVPVQTQYGWHVIQLEDTRDRPAPAFDDVKERLTQIVVAKKFKTHSDEMLKTAKIDPPLAATPAAPATTPAPAK